MKKVILLLTMLFVCSSVFADNLLVNYFKKWVDETRIENAIGKLLLDQFTNDLNSEFQIKEDNKLTQKFLGCLEKCGIKNNGGMNSKVMVIESSIPDEILLPGGILILTRGYLKFAASEEQEVLLQDKPLRIRFFHGIQNEAQRCEPGIHLHSSYHDPRHALIYDGSLYRF